MLLGLQGLALFLFIPFVLFVYLRQPFGPAVSIVVGLAIMFGHRFIAAPWMGRHSTERCLWCGREMATSTFTVWSGAREHVMAACGPAHRDLATRFLTFLARHGALIAVGIFVPLFILVIASLALAAGRPLLPQEWNTWQFRVIVAFTVVVVSFAYRIVLRAVEPLRSPFPLHNLFLLGIRNTLWIFRVVGAWWLVTGTIQILAALR